MINQSASGYHSDPRWLSSSISNRVRLRRDWPVCLKESGQTWDDWQGHRQDAHSCRRVSQHDARQETGRSDGCEDRKWTRQGPGDTKGRRQAALVCEGEQAPVVWPRGFHSSPDPQPSSLTRTHPGTALSSPTTLVPFVKLH